MTEFNLSEKELTESQYGGEEIGISLYTGEDVKEFIRLLKEELNNLLEWGIETKNINPNLADEIIEKIDKLAGERLK